MLNPKYFHIRSSFLFVFLAVAQLLVASARASSWDFNSPYKVETDIGRQTITVSGPNPLGPNIYQVQFGCRRTKEIPAYKFIVVSVNTSTKWVRQLDMQKLGISLPDWCTVAIYSHIGRQIVFQKSISNAIEIGSDVTGDSYIPVSFLAKREWRWIVAIVQKDNSDKVQRYSFRNERDGLDRIKLPLLSGMGEYKLTFLASKSIRKPKTFHEVSLGALFVKNLDPRSRPYLMASPNVPSHLSYFKNLAQEITQGKRGDLDRAQAIYEWVTRTISYDLDKYRQIKYEQDYAYDGGPIETILRKKGVCYDYAILYATLLRAIGIEGRVVFGDLVNGRDGSREYHAWVDFKSNGFWYSTDPTIDSGGFVTETFADGRTESRYISKPTLAHFAISDDLFSRNHQSAVIQLE